MNKLLVPTNYELLRWAAAIIDGIPDDHFVPWLDIWSTPCRTLFCAGGWLTQHPDLQARGLSAGDYHPQLLEGNQLHIGYSALARLFGITIKEAHNLFCALQSHEVGEKETFRRRVQRFLLSKGESLESELCARD